MSFLPSIYSHIPLCNYLYHHVLHVLPERGHGDYFYLPYLLHFTYNMFMYNFTWPNVSCMHYYLKVSVVLHILAVNYKVSSWVPTDTKKAPQPKAVPNRHQKGTSLLQCPTGTQKAPPPRKVSIRHQSAPLGVQQAPKGTHDDSYISPCKYHSCMQLTGGNISVSTNLGLQITCCTAIPRSPIPRHIGTLNLYLSTIKPESTSTEVLVSSLLLPEA